MKKTSKYILSGLLLIILVISGLAIAQHYGFSLTQIIFYQNRAQKKAEKIELQEKLEEALINNELLDMSQAVQQIDNNLMIVFNQMNLQVLPAAQEEQEILYREHPFRWILKTYQIEVPTFDRNPQEIRPLKEQLVQQILEQGGQLIDEKREETTDKIEEVLYFAHSVNDQLITTHELILTKVKPKARLAIVIDDLGYHWSEFERMMTIPRPMTFAVIPHLPESTHQAERVLEEGYDLIMHQPMEPISSLNPGEGAIYTEMTDEEIVDTLKTNLSTLPSGIIGVNNHMGSKVTADIRVMTTVLNYFNQQSLFFLDSKTSSQSIAEDVALEIGQPHQANNIFLDNVDQLADIETQLMKAGEIALQNSQAITIGHVKNYTAKAILEMIDELEAMGIQLVYVKDLLK